MVFSTLQKYVVHILRGRKFFCVLPAFLWVMVRVFAVLGDPISHSLSPVMHNAAFRSLGMEDCVYHAFRVPRGCLRDALLGARAMGFGGVNLTIPLKEEAVRLVEPVGIASLMGSVNTVEFKGGEMFGHSTDGIGASLALRRGGVDVEGRRVVLVGAGGAGRAIAFQLVMEGADIVFIVNRNRQRAVTLAQEIAGKKDALEGIVGRPLDGVEVCACGLDGLSRVLGEAEVLINATSVGMKKWESVVPARYLRRGLVVFDIVYNPRETRLLRDARERGCQVIEGVWMLVYQGAESFRIWTGVSPPVEVMEEAVRSALG